MADALTQIIQMTQTLEYILTQRYQAEGRGLHEKLTSVENEIPERARKQIRFVATIRNVATHEDITVAEEKLENVKDAYRNALAALDGKNPFEEIPYGDPLTPPKKASRISLERPNRPHKNRSQSIYPLQPQRTPNNNRRQNPQRRPQPSPLRPGLSLGAHQHASQLNRAQAALIKARRRSTLLLIVAGGLLLLVVVLILLVTTMASTLKSPVDKNAPVPTLIETEADANAPANAPAVPTN